MSIAPAPPDTAGQGWLARRPLVSYFLIAFAFTWVLLFSVLLSEDGLGLLPYAVSPTLARLIVPLSLMGPSLAALLVTAATEGSSGIGRLLRRIVRWRVGVRWYLFIFVGLPAVMVLGTLVRPGALESFDLSAFPPADEYLLAFAFMMTLGGPLFEEPGWRGFALPRPQRSYGPLLGGFILGSLWALWHLPAFLVPQKLPPSGTVLDFVRFTLALIALTYIIQWIVNHTRGSVLMAILTHASWNTFYAALVKLFPAPAVIDSYLNLTVAAWAAAGVIIALTRGRLGYQPELAASARGL
ncbi:MAG TPA: type II CAAX endopeptidase family protein [Gemmataceae bacterium]|nr:type II CAAX endopeptidase family protein [Gemmataceae bacterium]